jgi:hypothetical protein
MWKIALLSFLTLWSLPATAQDEFEFEGIYQGTMSIGNGTAARSVPLQLSVVLTGETATRPNGDVVQVIDGAFLVDGEGGAFPFNRVTFDLSDSRLDMRYTRPQMDNGDDSPASFRLIGNYQANGRITGRVLSGYRGPIGTFDVTWTNRGAFERISRYRGRWQGYAVLASGGEVPMSLQLVDAEGATINPVDLEFQYTNGKLANVHWNNLNFSISNISIDYLRGIITLRIMSADGRSDLSIEFSINSLSPSASSSAVGQIKSAYRGEIAHFVLTSN